MQKNFWLHLAFIVCAVGIKTTIAREATYKFQKEDAKRNPASKNKNHTKRQEKRSSRTRGAKPNKDLIDHRYERQGGTNDLSQPNMELRENFDLEQTTPRPTQTDQHHEYFVNH